MSHLRSRCALLLLLSPAAAQTFIVDAANGPGTSFTDLPPAVATVPDGATLLVRAGLYSPFSVVSKGLTILGSPGTEVSSWGIVTPFIGYTAPHQTVQVRGIRFRAALGAVRLFCNYCDGRVLLEDCSSDQGTYTGGTLIAFRCRELWLVRCAFYSSDQFYSPLAAVDSEVTVVRSSFGAQHSQPGIYAAGGHLTLAECTVQGGGNTNGSALLLNGASVRIGGATTLSGNFYTYLGLAPAIRGNGSARIDANTVLIGVAQPAFTPGVSVAFEAMPIVRSSTGPLGGTAGADVRGPVGALAALLVGLPGSPQLAAGIVDPFWLQPSTVSVQVVGTLTSLPLGGSYQVPNASWAQGIAVAWQAIVFDPTVGPVASNPSGYVHY